VPWYLVTIVPSDEGWVPVDDDDSNEGLIRRDLLAGEPGFANFVSLYRRNRAAPDSLPELRDSLKEVHRPSCSAWATMATWHRCFRARPTSTWGYTAMPSASSKHRLARGIRV